jgi:ATPase family associated with various cellular activities (AAA)
VRGHPVDSTQLLYKVFDPVNGYLKAIVGHRDIVDDTLTALIAGGHVLLEGVPGLGKTLLVRTLTDALHLKFQGPKRGPEEGTFLNSEAVWINWEDDCSLSCAFCRII